ncbi:DUF6090 family protein [Thalassobellus suaedae]|uniref:DUF6090 family protein n=1 Tax=Thalassobellus suaedae TaxID=3074124 RepID=A0ABY9Y5F9_9FLAO|nr:DUF6090 family protein [Flavobacteriaceae bacterium HL-DH14]WNH13297.1 DUF6090 family protein [Flavobacteriaceae bacterium HL-DH10]
MIKFFRKIRQDLLSKGKTGKYLKYAIGEIILVVIGILIALQINTWNENKKLDVIRHQYYGQLLDEFKEDTNYCNSIISIYNANILKYNNYRKSYKTPNLTVEEVAQNLLKLDFSYKNILFHTSTIQSLESTGDIKLIPPVIRNKILNLKRDKDRRVEVNKELITEYKERYRLASLLMGEDLFFLLKNQDELKKQIFSDNINSSKEIIKSLAAAQFTKNHNEKLIVMAFKELISEMKNIENLINDELDNK